MIFLLTQHPVWGVERCEGPDCPEAIPGLRTEVPEDPVRGDGDTLVTGRGVEITESERRLEIRRNELAEARRLAALEPAGGGAEVVPLNECEKISDRAEKCACVANVAKDFQKRSLAYKKDGSDDPSVVELMKKRDDLTARMAVVKTLLDVWDDYHNYLEKSPDLNGSASSPGNSPMAAINDLKKLRDFIGSHSKSIQRYHLTSEVLTTIFEDPNNREIKVRDILQGLESPEAKLDFIKAKIQARCSGSASNLYMCKNRSWEQITPRTDWDTPTNGEGDNLNRLANAIVAVDGLEPLDFRNTMNLSKLFVDRENINITGMSDVSSGLTGLIDAAIASCQQEVLNNASGETECFSRSLDSITEGNPTLKRQYETLKANFDSTLDKNYNMDNIGGLVNTYIHITKRTKKLHDETSGGTFKDLYNLTQSLGDVNSELVKASAALNDPANRSKIQNQFKSITKENLAKLGRTLAGMNLKESEEVYRKLGGSSSSGLFQNGAFQFKDKTAAQNANQVLNSILCREGSAADCSSNPINLFKEVDGKASVDESQLESTFGKLVSTIKDRGQLSEMLLPEREGSLASRVKAIDEKLESLNNDEEFKHMAAFKNYLYDRTRTFCVNDATPGNEEVKSNRCTLTSGIDVGLNNFLKVGGELIGIQNAVEHKMSVNNLSSLCQSIRESDFDTYNKNYLETGICPSVYDYKLTLERTTTRAASAAYDRNVRGIGDPNTIVDWESDGRGGYKVASVYRVPKATNISQYAIPLAQVGVTMIQPIMAHNLFGNQVDLMKNAGIQQEYNIAYQEHINNQYAQCDQSGTGANFFAYNNCITSINGYYYNGIPLGSNQNFSGGMNWGGSTGIISL